MPEESIEHIDFNKLNKKSISAPLVEHIYTADPSAHYFNGKIYIYPSHDIDAGEAFDDLGSHFAMEDYHVISMDTIKSKADVKLKCESCNGKRFKDTILEVKFKEKNIDDVLKMTIDQALNFFEINQCKKIKNKLQPLQDVGLGYVTLGQSSSTLSGGEAQRIKLASFLGKGSKSELGLFIFDEPSTGLHFHDIKKLLKSFNALIDQGHSIIVIEHNLELIKSSDYIIDLGPEGGENGGYVMAHGTPEMILDSKTSLTAKYLNTVLSNASKNKLGKLYP
jgi:excinuclease ABC subunit A